MKETLPQSVAHKSYVQQWECLAMLGGLLHRRWETAEDVIAVDHSAKVRRSLIFIAHMGMTGGHRAIAGPSSKTRLLAWVEI